MDWMREQIAYPKQPQIQVQGMRFDGAGGRPRALRRAIDAEKQRNYASLDMLTCTEKVDLEKRNDQFVDRLEKGQESWHSEKMEQRPEEMQASLDSFAKAAVCKRRRSSSMSRRCR